MFTLFLNAIGGLSQSLIQVLTHTLRLQPKPILVIDPVRLWSVQQEHYWDQTDW